jgi:hypothetical protein
VLELAGQTRALYKDCYDLLFSKPGDRLGWGVDHNALEWSLDGGSVAVQGEVRGGLLAVAAAAREESNDDGDGNESAVMRGNESEATSKQPEESRDYRGKPGVVHDPDFNFPVDSKNEQGDIENDDEGNWDEGDWDEGDLENGEDSDESLVHIRKRRNQVLDESDTDETNKCWTSSDNESENNEATPPKRSYVKRSHESEASRTSPNSSHTSPLSPPWAHAIF